MTKPTSTLIKLPVVSFRRIVSPYEESGARTYIAVVNVKDIPEVFEDWRGLNPRDPKTTSGVAKKISDTLSDDPSSFFFRNRGITLIVEKTRFDNQNNIVELEMEDKEHNGLLDGGHTFRIIRNYVESLSEDEYPDFCAFVKIEVIEGVSDTDLVANIVEARNTSTQVKEQSLEELRKSYDAIHLALDNLPYGQKIAYKEYELSEDGSPKDIDIKDILSYLVCFDAEAFDKTHPIKAYSTRSSVVDHFKHNKDRILKYVPLVPMILELRDHIYLELPKAWNKSGGRFGALTGVVETSNKPRMEKVHLPFIRMDSTYRIPNGFIYPILASFRNLVRVSDDKCVWKTDPIKFSNEIIEDLSKIVCKQATGFNNPNKLGKDEATWTMCYQAVELATLRRGL